MDDIINEILQELESPKTTISDEKLQTFCMKRWIELVELWMKA